MLCENTDALHSNIFKRIFCRNLEIDPCQIPDFCESTYEIISYFYLFCLTHTIIVYHAFVYVFFVRILSYYIWEYFKGPLLGLRQFVETEGPL